MGNRWARLLACVVLIAGSAFALAACGSSSSSDSGSASAGSAGSSGASAGGSGGGSSDIAARVEAAKKVTPASYQGPTTPVKPPARPLKLALISCSSALRGCVTPLQGAAEAVRKLGWSTQMFDGRGDPKSQNDAFLAAVSSGADAIIYTSIDPNLIQQGLTAAKKANIPVLSASAGWSDPNPTVRYPGKVAPAFDVSHDVVKEGQQVADWVINDSGGKANVLLVVDPAFGLPSVYIDAARRELAAACPDCQIHQMNVAGTQLATTGPGQVVGYLRSNPDYTYVLAPYDPAAAAFAPAISQAGLTNVKMCSILGLQENVNFIRQGQVQACDGGWDNRYMGYATVDQLLRLLARDPPARPLGENIPFVLLDRDNLPAEGEDWTAPYDYRRKFLDLWGVGSN
jgi:ABC-type sugar transport system substrate-binding protein